MMINIKEDSKFWENLVMQPTKRYNFLGAKVFIVKTLLMNLLRDSMRAPMLKMLR